MDHRLNHQPRRSSYLAGLSPMFTSACCIARMDGTSFPSPANALFQAALNGSKKSGTWSTFGMVEREPTALSLHGSVGTGPPLLPS